jgi:hypothetical protein
VTFIEALEWLRENPGRECAAAFVHGPPRLRWEGEAKIVLGPASIWYRCPIEGSLFDDDWDPIPLKREPAPATAWTATPRELGALDRPTGEGATS